MGDIGSGLNAEADMRIQLNFITPDSEKDFKHIKHCLFTHYIEQGYSFVAHKNILPVMGLLFFLDELIFFNYCILTFHMVNVNNITPINKRSLRFSIIFDQGKGNQDQ